ncbi:MAG TPA: BON domain-containing protein [Pyrinomonadaceae bacterium]|nr:BON domain-containing protein [Pyrinomonadaceae bacterium]
MSTRYRNLEWERDDDRYGREDDERGRYYERGLYGTRGLEGGRDYEDYGYLGGAYGGGAYGRGGARDYGRDYGRDYTTGEYRRDYGARRGREGAGRDFIDRGYERSYRREDDRGGYETDYGRTTSRFYGERGQQHGREEERDDYGRGYGAFGGYGRRSRRDDDDDDDDRRERRYRARGDERGWWDRAADEVRSWFGRDEDEDDRRRYGREGGGRYRGRGPRNYRRSDERIRDDINDRLTENDWLDASDIEVQVTGGEVTLIGTVESRYAKRLAEDIAESVSGVTHVQNNLRVKRGWEMGLGSPAVNTEAVGEAGTTGITGAADLTDSTDVTKTSRAAGGQS